MPPSPQNNHRRPDSNGVRASIFDVCYQLGALDNNSLIAEWMFNDPLSTNRPVGRRYHGTTRFQEVLSPVDEDSGDVTDGAQPHRRFPFSLFGARPKSKAKARVHSGTDSHDDDSAEAIDSSPSAGDGGQPQSSMRNNGLFFRRSLRRRKSETLNGRRSGRSSRTASTRHDSGYASIKSKSALRRVTELGEEDSVEVSDLPSAIPAATSGSTSLSTLQRARRGERVQQDDDDDWEEVEVMPESPLYALNNKGINPRPVHSTPDPARDVKRNNKHGLLPSFPRFTFRSSTPSPVPSSPPSSGSSSLAAPPKRTPSKLSKSPPPSPSPYHTQNHKQLSVQTPTPIAARFRHGHTRSASLPTSPFVPFPSAGSPNHHRNYKPNSQGNETPRQASPVVFADDAAVPSGGEEDQLAYRASMGYHNQFFVRPPAVSLGGGSGNGNAVGSLPAKGKGRMIPFLNMKKG